MNVAIAPSKLQNFTAYCRIERKASKVAEILADDLGCLWVIIGSAAAPTEHLIQLERNCPGRELSRNLTDSERVRASQLASDFFVAAERGDPKLRFNFSARVPLAIPDWDDVQQIFRLSALREHRPDMSIIIWLADPAMEPMLTGNSFAFLSRGRLRLEWPWRAIARGIRAFLRCILNPAPHLSGGRFWLTLGHQLKPNAQDTYFGDWWRSASGSNFRVYFAGGADIRLGQHDTEAPIEAFGRVSDVFAALYECWQPPQPPVVLASGFERVLWLWLARREWMNGDMFALVFTRLVCARLFKRTAPTSIVVPFEARSWERLLIREARQLSIPVIGYQHSSITPRHIALLNPGSGWCRGDLPDRIVTCGDVTAERLRVMAEKAQVDLVAGAALRTSRNPLPLPDRTLLVAISSSYGESRAILQFIHRVADRLNMPIIIRPHPTIPINDLFRELQWPPSVRMSSGRSLDQDLADACLIAYSSSTVALEGLIHGRLPVFLDICDVLSGDPIDDGEFKLRATSPDELVICINDFLTWPVERLGCARKLGFAYAERYLSVPNAERLDRMAAALLP